MQQKKKKTSAIFINHVIHTLLNQQTTNRNNKTKENPTLQYNHDRKISKKTRTKTFHCNKRKH